MDARDVDDFAGGIFIDPKGNGGLIVLFDVERNRTWKKKITAFYSKADGVRVLREYEAKGIIKLGVLMKWEAVILISTLSDDASVRGTPAFSGYMASALALGFLRVKKFQKVLPKLHPIFVEMAMPPQDAVTTSPEGLILLGAHGEFLAVLVYAKDIARITLGRFRTLMSDAEIQLLSQEIENSRLPETDRRDFEIVDGWPAKAFAAALLVAASPDEASPDNDEDGPGEPPEEPPPVPDEPTPPTVH